MNFIYTLVNLGGPEIVVLIMGLPLLLMILALINIVRSDFKDSNNKLIWALAVIFLPLIGSLLYFLFGRNQKAQ